MRLSCSSCVRPNHSSTDRQLPLRDSFPRRGVGRFEKAKISYACSPQLPEATIRCASQRPSHTRKRALQRQSNSTLSPTRLHKTLRLLGPIVGSEEARCRAGLRPPLKLYVPISGIQLSRRWPRTRAIAQGRNQRNQVEQANLAVQLRGRQLLPAATPPSPISVRPNTPHDPAVEFVEERSDVGTLVVLAPPTQCWIQLLDQLLGLQRGTSPRQLPHPISEAPDRLLCGVG